jgi:nucleoside-diphosphate-sugar epimerase
MTHDDNPLVQDLEHILDHTRELWEDLRGQRIFITGGTGFFGCWLLESLCWANDRLNLGASATVLTRDPPAFSAKVPHLANHRAVTLQPGDVRDFTYPIGSFSHVIHAATEASSQLNRDNPLIMLDTIVEGTRHTLDFAQQCGAQRLLFTSSGAVYGRQPTELHHVPEEYTGAPSPSEPLSAYGEGKRIAELLCTLYSKPQGMQATIARCFAFVGPYLPLTAGFAIGNFLADAMAGRPIRINGDGTPYRSYLYAADLAIWLWTILMRGQACRPYNVGSEEGLTILEIAQRTASLITPETNITVLRQPDPTALADRYVPSTQRAQTELHLRQYVDFADAIQRTVVWHRGKA